MLAAAAAAAVGRRPVARVDGGGGVGSEASVLSRVEFDCVEAVLVVVQRVVDLLYTNGKMGSFAIIIYE